jgi:hypothetical protein
MNKRGKVIGLVFLVLFSNFVFSQTIQQPGQYETTDFNTIKDDPAKLTDTLKSDPKTVFENQVDSNSPVWEKVNPDDYAKGLKQYSDQNPAKTVNAKDIPSKFRGAAVSEYANGKKVNVNNLPDDMTFRGGKMYTTVNGKEAELDPATLSDGSTIDTAADGALKVSIPSSQTDATKKTMDATYKNPQGLKPTANGGTIVDQADESTFTDRNDPTNVVKINDGKNIQNEDGRLTIDEATGLDYRGSTAQNVKKFTTIYDGTYTVEKAKKVTDGKTTFWDIINSIFKVVNGKIAEAKAESEIDENEWEIESPFPSAGQIFIIHANSTDIIDYRMSEENGQKSFSVVQDQGVMTEFYNNNLKFMDFSTTKDSGYLKVTDGTPAAFQMQDSIIRFLTKKFTEYVETYGVTKGGINIDLGAGYIILAPISSPGGRYTYEDLANKEASFSIYNPSKVPYYVGFKKSGEFFDEARFAQIKKGDSWGYVDFTKSINRFVGKINFETYRNKALTETESDYDLLQRATMKNVYEGSTFDDVYLTFYQGKISNFIVKSKAPDVIARSGIFELSETSGTRFLSTNFKLIFPDRIENYESAYQPKIKIYNETLEMTGNHSIYFHKHGSIGAKEIIQKTRQIMSFQEYLQKTVYTKWQS